MCQAPKFDAGMDVKYSITNNLTSDLTINTDFAQVEADHDAFVQSQQRWFDHVEKSRFIVKERSIHPDPTGTYARFYQIVDFEGVAEGKPYLVKNTRMSGILEKQNGRWVMVQWHGSVPVSGQMVKY